MKFRKEYDSIGSINVPVDKYWGASTQRSKKFFDIGDVLVRPKLIKSIAIIKKGEKFSTENIKRIRPGHGLEPKYYERILGKKSPKNLSKGNPLRMTYLKKIFVWQIDN